MMNQQKKEAKQQQSLCLNCMHFLKEGHGAMIKTNNGVITMYGRGFYCSKLNWSLSTTYIDGKEPVPDVAECIAFDKK